MLERAGIHLSFLEWTLFGAPIAVGLACLVFGYFQWQVPADGSSVARVTPDARPLGRGEQVTALAFALAAVGWLVPGVAEAMGLSATPWLEAHLPAGGVALLAASVLFMFRDETGRQPVLPWTDAAGIDWGLVLLFGGGISLGNQMFDTGLAQALGEWFIAMTGVRDVWVLTAVASLLCLFLTEACSNMATANMLVPLVIGVAQALHVSPLGPALAVGISASCAFMLPIATGPNAIAYGTGKVPMPVMLRHGLALNLLCWGAIVAYVRLVAGWLEP
jgi:sodium-dependent dicarboxylate transporter 2/3/5